MLVGKMGPHFDLSVVAFKPHYNRDYVTSKARNIHYLALCRKFVTSALGANPIQISSFLLGIFHSGVGPGAGRRKQYHFSFFLFFSFVTSAATHNHCLSALFY